MITLKSATGFSDYELQLLSEAIDKVNQVQASPAFQSAVYAITNFACTTDSQSRILQNLRLALSIDFFIFDPTFWQRHFSKEIAFEDSQGVHFMRSKYDAESFAEICNTAAHEACHSAGYVHPFNECPDRDNSVPYQIGNLIESLVGG